MGKGQGEEKGEKGGWGELANELDGALKRKGKEERGD